jgi:hypothetical protein
MAKQASGCLRGQEKGPATPGGRVAGPEFGCALVARANCAQDRRPEGAEASISADWY